VQPRRSETEQQRLRQLRRLSLWSGTTTTTTTTMASRRRYATKRASSHHGAVELLPTFSCCYRSIQFDPVLCVSSRPGYVWEMNQSIPSVFTSNDSGNVVTPTSRVASPNNTSSSCFDRTVVVQVDVVTVVDALLPSTNRTSTMQESMQSDTETYRNIELSFWWQWRRRRMEREQETCYTLYIYIYILPFDQS
jgi:hypothetical protein